MSPFGDRLDAAFDARGSLCVGIDPHAALLESWGLSADPDGLGRFADTCVRAFADVTAVVKPQSAFFEVFGSAGIAVLERTVSDCREAGALVLLDVKRGDIGSTMSAYAQAYLDPASALAADAITVSPYLGVGSLQPAFDLADRHGGGVFVLAATSNPEGPQVQHARTADDRLLAQLIVDEVGKLGRSVGVVAGATIEPGVIDFGAVDGPILVPGVGAQGGTAESVRAVFGGAQRDVLASVSREVLRHGPDPAALRSAALRLIDEFAFLRG